MFDLFGLMKDWFASSFVKHLSTKITIDSRKCWNWTGYLDHAGYGRISIGAHKLFYLLLKGNYDNNMELHHKCKNPRCVNPEHLQPMTPEEHHNCTLNFATINKNKEYCSKGHKFTIDNTYLYKKSRRCKMCIVRHNYIQHNIIEKYKP